MRVELDILKKWITPNSRVLDLGCGDGALLHSLKESHGIEGYGLEIDPEGITACIQRGVNVIETDINKGLGHFSDDSFDTVVMTNSLQALLRPDRTIEEMLRIGKECVVTFPNFGNIKALAYLYIKGRMPVTRQLSYQWYDTPNIHFCTVKDFETLCREKRIRIIDRATVASQTPGRQLQVIWPNLFAETAIYYLSK
ncbi:MAG: methionine biosynthesis protein MetW [Porticoccaceae bacterium]